MRKSITLFALAAFLFAACGDDDLVQDYSPAQVGDEINFGGNAAFENASNAPEKNSRTVYGDKNETGTEVLWYEGDKVRIACPQSRPTADGSHFVDYQVQDFIPTTGEGLHDNNVGPHSTALARCADESYGLQWGGTGKHDFYAVYPSVDQFAAATEGGNASLMAADSKEVTSYNLNCTAQGATFTGYLPSSQDAPLGSKMTFKDRVYTVHPAMRYAYMVAKNENITPNGSPIPLKFHPIVTAVEVTLKNNTKPVEGDSSTTTSLNDISMVGLSAAAPICGQFTYNFEDGSCKLDEDGAKKLVSVSVKNEHNLPVSLKKGESLKVTFFLMPNANLKNLSVSIMAGSVIKTANLSGNYGGKDFEIQVKKKNFINNLPVTLGASDASNWLSALPDETPLYNLSIPGAANAFSGEVALSNPKMADQTLTFEQLWAKGVRCFELWTNESAGGDLGAQTLVCGAGVVFKSTLKQAMDKLQTKLQANPKEFAIAIIGYQPTTGDASPRNAATWNVKFNQYYDNDKNFTTLGNENRKLRTLQYSPSLTLGQARGHLFTITRNTSAGADPWWNSICIDSKPAAGDSVYKHLLKGIVSVAGWGSLTDQWYKRGFVDKGQRPFYVGKEKPSQALMSEIAGRLEKPVVPNAVNRPTDAFTHPGLFSYEVFTSTQARSKDVFLYAQDWRRISKLDGPVQHDGLWYYWPKSFDKKFRDVKNAFSAMKYAEQGLFDKTKVLLINCLAGFYIEPNISQSVKPIKYYVSATGKANGTDGGKRKENIQYESSINIGGSWLWPDNRNCYDDFGGYAGDIAGFANDMNRMSYNHIIEVGVKNINYPLGIVMMSRIDNVQPNPADPNANVGGYYLPQIIVANNFK